jgi:hypothetical protein
MSFPDEPIHHVRSDETRTTGDQNFHRFSSDGEKI